MMPQSPILFLLACWLGQSLSAPSKAMQSFKIDNIQDDLLNRERRSSVDSGDYDYKLNCIDLKYTEGEYYFTTGEDGKQTGCNIYFIAEPDEEVVLEFKHFDVPCEDGENMTFFDGWYVQKDKVFPAVGDHHTPINDRFQFFCGKNTPKSPLVASQNVAQLFFIISKPKAGFSVMFSKQKIRKPCNAVSMTPDGIHTLRNYGNKGNCTFSIMYATRIAINDVNVVGRDEEGYDNCSRGRDVVQFLKADGPASPNSLVVTEVCGDTGNKVKAKGNIEMRWSESCDPDRMSKSSPPLHTTSSPSLSSSHRYVMNDDVTSDGSADEPLLRGTLPFLSPPCYNNAHFNVVLNCMHSIVRLVSGGTHDNHVTFEYKAYEGREADICAV